MMNKNRLEAFSDGVFAIVITLLVLDIRLPEAPDTSVRQGIIELIPSILSFVFSFLVIGLYWVAHHRMIHYIDKVDTATLWLNIVLLLTVSFLPFPTSIIGQHPMDTTAIWLYASNLMAVNLAGGIFWWFSTKKPELRHETVSLALRRRGLILHSVPSVICLVAALISAVHVYFSYGLFLLIILYFILPFNRFGKSEGS